MLSKSNLEDTEKTLNLLQKEIKRIRKDIDVIISVFDSEYIDMYKRLRKLENRFELE